MDRVDWGLRKLLAVIICGFLMGSLYSQEPYLVHFGTEDGLPSKKVYCVTQDSKGLIWIGTENGLVRYNGINFKTFTTEDGLPDNDVFSIGEDADGRLWIICFKQAPCYFYKNKLYTTKNDTFLAKYFNCQLRFAYNINQSEKRVVFLVKSNDYNKYYILEKNRAISIIGKNHVSVMRFSEITIDLEKYLIIDGKFVSMSTGIINYSVNLSKVSQYNINSRIRKYLFVEDYTNDQIGIFKYSNGKLNLIKNINTDRYTCIKYIEEIDNLLFVDRDNNLFTLDTINLNLIWLNKFNMKGRTKQIYLDNTKHLWLCTQEEGLYLTNYSENDNITQIISKSSTSFVNSLHNGVFTIRENSDVIQIKNRKKYKVHNFGFDNNRNYKVTALIVKSEKLFVGGDLDYHFKNIHSGNLIKTVKARESVKDMEIIEDSLVLVATSLGVNIFSLNKGEFINKLWNIRTYAAYGDYLGDIYFGTLDGLFIRDHLTEKIDKYKSGTGLDNSRITDIKVDKDNRVYISTANNGLYIKIGKKLINIVAGSGNKKINSNQLKHIHIDDNNVAWLSGTAGINKVIFDKNNNYRTERFLFPFGLPDNNINACVTDGKYVYIATLSGVFYAPMNAGKNEARPSVIFTRVETLSGDMTEDDLRINTVSGRRIRISYSPILFQNAPIVSYKYRMIGLHSDWVESRNDNAEFTDLEPGDYFFELIAVNTMTGEESEIKRMHIEITRVWYRQYWFYAICMTLIGYGIYRIFQERLKRVKERSEQEFRIKRQLLDLEMQAIRAHMNPHFIFNALTAIQHYYSEAREELANEFMHKFSILIRRMLDYSQENFIGLEEEVDLVKNYMDLEKLRFENKLEFELDLAPDLVLEEYQIPSLLLQPVLENAVNHGIRTLDKEKGKITLRIWVSEEMIHCRITDNGIGLNESQARKSASKYIHKSKSTDMLKKRLESIRTLYQAKVEYTLTDRKTINPNEHGTVAELIVPVYLELPEMQEPKEE